MPCRDTRHARPTRFLPPASRLQSDASNGLMGSLGSNREPALLKSSKEERTVLTSLADAWTHWARDADRKRELRTLIQHSAQHVHRTQIARCCGEVCASSVGLSSGHGSSPRPRPRRERSYCTGSREHVRQSAAPCRFASAWSPAEAILPLPGPVLRKRRRGAQQHNR